ncbi:MAG: preprotein translocase subunit YajC [Alphaproteobacteria bacterium RIFCSPLOWO2_01_FULL_45_8]|nr:MAG: preprotein translocase subunit YajC [Alphaproteobacteria bacterium GWB1_45_5]OFW76392.1 MAG: preprotein translocase subunit YajC [Alphaproteobacteria bacterium GWA1_45_9]OFW89333.1 MAG: preprotein translocase subunit YajC [Alphaproteobacteria bacterium RIFCSPHIGHO2_01_FULL_41_14]OFW96146.1 MAG: preprotein translocase subunit YajC [Alphaproteobacteria bacterium RIFCSPLOWO2_01_FULL_45_8]HCI48311.1 preprotein translocase subunit YajC [Holosporales bacterium]
MKPGFDFMSILPLVLIFVVMYFLVIRPQSKKAKQHQNMISGLKKGDRVVMNGGLIGTVLKVSEGELELSIAPSTNVSVAKQMVSTLLSADNITESTVIEKKKR